MDNRSLRIAKAIEVFTKINRVITTIIVALSLTEGLLWILRYDPHAHGVGIVYAFFYMAPIFFLDMLALVLFLLATVLLLISLRNPYKLIIRIAYKEFTKVFGKTLLLSIIAVAIPMIITSFKH